MHRLSAVLNGLVSIGWLRARFGRLSQVEFCYDTIFVSDDQCLLEMGSGLFFFEWKMANLSLLGFWAVFCWENVIQEVKLHKFDLKDDVFIIYSAFPKYSLSILNEHFKRMLRTWTAFRSFYFTVLLKSTINLDFFYDNRL